MSLWDRVASLIATTPVETEVAPKDVPRLIRAEAIRARGERHQRAIDSFTSMPGLTEQLLAVQGLTDRPWRPASIREALGVPAVFRAVSLIANTVGRLNLEAYRNGVRMDQADAPRVIVRPDPFRTARDFFRDTAFYIAATGEAWWWVGARDIDNSAMSLICVPPWEVTVEENQRDRLRPTIKWLGKEVRREDMRHITFLPDGYRGVGPLQLCGAAVSVTVEAQEWAANFYSTGGYPSIYVQAAVEMDETEAKAFKAQWTESDPNTPKIGSPAIDKVQELGANVQSAQMLEARSHQDGDAARMFGIPGALLEYAQSGTSLTYQNVESVWRQFQEGCLTPNYLEPIEQEISDLLTRSTVARFNLKGLLRADIKTRYDVHQIAIANGIYDADQARAEEGYAPGDVEFAPVPFAPPTAYPTLVPPNQRKAEAPAEPFRCDGTVVIRGILRRCNRKLTDGGPAAGLKCGKCGKVYPSMA